MNKDTRIHVAGHRGLAGSAIVRALEAAGQRNLLLRTHAELDLADQSAVRDFYAVARPEMVVLAAGKVGGILANQTYPGEFIHENLALQTTVIHAAWRAGVRRLLFLGSSCIYPKDAPQPIREEYLLTGPLEATNRPYALAKIAGIEMCWAYNRQYGTRYLAVMPTNLYGPGDNYDLATSHLLPALIRKFHEARVTGRPPVLWGSGTPRREFLHSDDLAAACLHLLDVADDAPGLDAADQPPLINIGCGQDHTVRELAALVADVVGYAGPVAWDTSKPDGTPCKRLDVSRLAALGWRPRIGLREGIAAVYRDFIATGPA